MCGFAASDPRHTESGGHRAQVVDDMSAEERDYERRAAEFAKRHEVELPIQHRSRARKVQASMLAYARSDEGRERMLNAQHRRRAREAAERHDATTWAQRVLAGRRAEKKGEP
jgi:hypothetical protein